MHASGRSRVLRAVTMAAAVIIGATACESSSSSTTPAPAATTTTSSTTTSTTIAPAAVTATGSELCDGHNCKVGDTGPGGGIIIQTTGGSTFKCGPGMRDRCNTVEMAPAGWQKTLTDSGLCTEMDGDDPNCKVSTTAKNLGTTYGDLDGGLGWYHTTNLAKTSGDISIYRMAMSYRGGGLSDWHVPFHGDFLANLAALKEGASTGLNTALKLVAGGKYWSSFTSGSGSQNLPMVFKFTGGRNDSMSTSNISTPNRLRPIRTFLDTPVAAPTTTVKATTTTVKATTTTVAASTTTAAPTTTTTTSTTTTLAPTTTVATCAQGGTCVVGDTGPGGGTVYYVSANGFSCGVTMSSTCHYLEVSPANWKASTASSANCTAAGTENVECVWASASLSTFIDTSGAVGNGAKNTKAIIDGVGVLNSWAAVVSKAYQGGGKSDWFLPSQHELDELCKFANGQTTGDQSVACARGTLKTGFYPGNYWSSNDGGSGKAISIDLMHGVQAFPSKDLARLIRPVRAF